MRQFILTVGTLVTVLLSCWFFFQGISSISKGELQRSLLFIFVATPIILSLAVCFSYVNAQLHLEFREKRRAQARKKGLRRDIHQPEVTEPIEVFDTPWENDSTHTR